MTDVASNINKILSEYLKGNKKFAYVKLKKISKEHPSNEKLKFNLAFMEQDQGNIQEAKKGYLFLIGRKKDLIISGGLNVFPKELELVIDSFTEVKESAVIGLPHPDFGEQVVAVIVAEKTSRLDKPMLINKMRNKIASFKIPKEVYFFDELPRNTMGKVQKNLLRKTLS